MATLFAAAPPAEYRGIALDASSVYFADYQNGAIQKLPLAGGVPAPLVSGQQLVTALTRDATQVYWGVSGAIWRAPLAGNGVPSHVSSAIFPLWIVAGPADVYWTDTGGGLRCATIATPGDNCRTGGGGGGGYGPGRACDHFGVGTSAAPTRTTYSRLLETATPGQLSKGSVFLPAPLFDVVPAPDPADPPVVGAEIAVPPTQDAELFGAAMWVEVP